jgi:hypothetical protein
MPIAIQIGEYKEIYDFLDETQSNKLNAQE